MAPRRPKQNTRKCYRISDAQFRHKQNSEQTTSATRPSRTAPVFITFRRETLVDGREADRHQVVQDARMRTLAHWTVNATDERAHGVQSVVLAVQSLDVFHDECAKEGRLAKILKQITATLANHMRRYGHHGAATHFYHFLAIKTQDFVSTCSVLI